MSLGNSDDILSMYAKNSSPGCELGHFGTNLQSGWYSPMWPSQKKIQKGVVDEFEQCVPFHNIFEYTWWTWYFHTVSILDAVIYSKIDLNFFLSGLWFQMFV